MKKTGKQYREDAARNKRNERERKRASGWRAYTAWIRPEWKVKIKELIAELENTRKG